MKDLDKNNKEIGKTIATKVPINIHNELLSLIENGAYLSISDFLREAIRDQLKSYKIANMKNIDYNEAKKEVISYFIKYKDCFLDEIALDLELDFELVDKILNDLLREGRIVKNSIGEEPSPKKKSKGKKSKESKNDENYLLKFKGKRLIVEAPSKDLEFISLRHNYKDKLILKNRGFVLDNGSVILSEHYSFVK